MPDEPALSGTNGTNGANSAGNGNDVSNNKGTGAVADGDTGVEITQDPLPFSWL